MYFGVEWGDQENSDASSNISGQFRNWQNINLGGTEGSADVGISRASPGINRRG